MNNKRHGLRAETALRDILNERGYLCIRSAASKLVDLIAFDSYGFCFCIEVKAVLGDTYRTSRTAFQREQHLEMMRFASIYGTETTNFVYAIRYGNGDYRIFPLDREIFRYAEGVPLDETFPDVCSALPQEPPYSPPVSIAPPGYSPGSLPETQTTEASAEYARSPEPYDATGGATD